jgi:aconitate hydratase
MPSSPRPPWWSPSRCSATRRGDITRDPLGTLDGTRSVLPISGRAAAEIDAAARGDPADDYAAVYDAAEDNADWAAFDAPSTQLFPGSRLHLSSPAALRADRGESRGGSYAAHTRCWCSATTSPPTTSHPPAPSPRDSDAARWLVEHGEIRADLNVFSSRRGNWEVMLRGLFTNRSVRNLLGDGTRARRDTHAPSGERLPLWQAAARYAEAGQPS